MIDGLDLFNTISETAGVWHIA